MFNDINGGRGDDNIIHLKSAHHFETFLWKKMDMAIRQSVCESFARMRARRKAKEAKNIPPDVPCANCGENTWEADMDGEWYCFICGNRGYWENGVFQQGRKSCVSP